MDAPQGSYHDNNQNNMAHHSLHSQQYAPRGSTSAPAHIAFRTNSSLPHPADLDFDIDISPLTSPWLGAHQSSSSSASMPAQQATRQSRNKRTASPSGDEQESTSISKPSRKKQSPAIRPTNPNPNKVHRGSKSTTSTPLLRSTRSRKGSTAGDGMSDTPSPVDLSMPPPAPPLASSASSSPTFVHQSYRGLDVAQMTPVTPASIMNLGRLGINSSLAPPSPVEATSKRDTKGKGTARAKDNPRIRATSTSKKSLSNNGGALLSPSLKAILPGQFLKYPTRFMIIDIV